jgi:hypothetical protein
MDAKNMRHRSEMEVSAASPLKERMHAAVDDFMDLARSLFGSISDAATGSSASRAVAGASASSSAVVGGGGRSPTEAMAALLRKDSELTEACAAIERHLVFERQCQTLRHSIAQEDKVIVG